jgi:3D (Asp-Asp-Asp) domain-containing protein
MTASGTFKTTAYGPPWGGIEGTGVTATGINLLKSPNQYIVAVDPAVIPLGSKLKIWPNPFGDPNIVFSAEDTGGAIKGNRIDFYDPAGRQAQNDWGVRGATVKLLDSNTLSTNATTSSGSPPPPTTPPAQGGGGGGGGGGDFTNLFVKAFLYIALVGGAAALIFYGTRTTLQPLPTA